MEATPLVRVRIRRPTATLWHTGHLTPYLAETILSDIRRAAHRVDVFVAGDADTAAIVRARLAAIDRPYIRIVTRPRSSAGAAA
jgi:hypothetical protein